MNIHNYGEKPLQLPDAFKHQIFFLILAVTLNKTVPKCTNGKAQNSSSSDSSSSSEDSDAEKGAVKVSKRSIVALQLYFCY